MMKQKWITFVLAALLVVALAGCGEQSGKTDKKATDTDSQYALDGNSDKPENKSTGTDKNDDEKKATDTQTNEKTKIDNTVSGTQTSGLSAESYVAGELHQRSWQQMVENGTVRDRDGDLTDGENSHW